jgi:hypothetical protein
MDLTDTVTVIIPRPFVLTVTDGVTDTFEPIVAIIMMTPKN